MTAALLLLAAAAIIAAATALAARWHKAGVQLDADLDRLLGPKDTDR